MSVSTTITCNRCTAYVTVQGRAKHIKGWTRGRGYSTAGRRPILDWCPPCSKNRRAAKAMLRGAKR